MPLKQWDKVIKNMKEQVCSSEDAKEYAQKKL